MKPDGKLAVKKTDVRMIAFGNLEFDSLFICEKIAKIVIHVLLKRVTGLRRDTLLFSCPTVVTAVTDD